MPFYGKLYEEYFNDPVTEEYVWYDGQLEKIDGEIMPHGVGKSFDHRQNLIYEGEWFQGKEHGQGKVKMLVYYCEGHFSVGEIEHGRLYYYNGEIVYDGEMSGRTNEGLMRNGRGKGYSNNILEYEGEWQYDLKHGQGKLYQGGRLVYDGTFSRSKRSGKGKSFYADGTLEYDGYWCEDDKHGKGKLFKDGILVHEGEWVSNELTSGQQSQSPIGSFDKTVIAWQLTPTLTSSFLGPHSMEKKVGYYLCSDYEKRCNAAYFAVGADGTIYLTVNQVLRAITNPKHRTDYPYPAPVYDSKWKFYEYISSPPVIGSDGTIYATGEGEKMVVFAINPDGTQKWKREFGPNWAQAVSVTVDSSDNLYVYDRAFASLYKLDTEGNIKWGFTLPEFENKRAYTWAPPVVNEDGITHMRVKGIIYSIDSNGLLKWKFDTGSGEFSDSKATSAFDSGVVYAVSGDDKVIFAIGQDGKERWRYERSSDEKADYAQTYIAVGPDKLISWVDGSRILTFNGEGVLLWEYEADRYCYFGMPVVDAAGVLYIAQNDGVVHAIDKSGRLVKRVKYRNDSNQGITTIGLGTEGILYLASIEYFYAIAD